MHSADVVRKEHRTSENEHQDVMINPEQNITLELQCTEELNAAKEAAKDAAKAA